MLRCLKRLLISLLCATALVPLTGYGAAPQRAQRILSLDLCLDWLVAHHADRQRVVALSPLQERYPIDWIGPEWPLHDGSLEQIYALRPDLVVVGQYAAPLLRERLRGLGVRVEVLPLPLTLAQVVEYEKQFLRALRLPETRASEVPAPAPRPERAQRLLLLGSNGIGTGRDTLEHEILEHAGWSNYLRDSGYVRLDLEQIASDPPDAILWAAPDHQALANQFAEHPVLTRVVPAERWLTTDLWRWQCPGPWTWDLIGQLNRWLD